ncbi:hypothetical protein [Paenibacillus sp. BC26]|uniref:hypothetical protein n=1 Tax=Paenibacillus sp. BC26 TaxID=1881032 RepID=UPI0008F0E624|nr:hypothetical protein [Paenibacillus sp. BC26]SFS55266.1 hypothetical protein SAMN05428962_0775 [Paenibacillus sp. BC26]
MKPIRLHSAINNKHGPRYRRLLFALFASHFFCTVQFVSAGYALSEGFNLSPISIGLNLITGIMLCVGAYIPDNMLARSAWSSIPIGLLLCMFASVCLLSWSGSDSSVITFAVSCAGFGFAVVNLGVSSEKAEVQLQGLPDGFKHKMVSSRVLGLAIGFAISALFAIVQWGGFHIGLMRLVNGCAFCLLAVCFICTSKISWVRVW